MIILVIFPLLLFKLFSNSHLLSALSYKEAEIAAQKINKPALLTILSPDGDLIDCVDETKQPAFDHPLLKNHKLQKVAKTWEEKQRDDEYPKRYVNGVTQVWHQNGTRCPVGTVPIRRVKVEEIMRVSSISEFGKKPKPLGRNLVPGTTSQGETEKAFAGYKIRDGVVVHGASATINVWNLTVENPNEFSLSQIWIFSGEEDGYNTVEAGWRVEHGSTTPTLFTYWTSDEYRTTGCYNTICPSGVGFVQNNPGVAVGVALEASTKGGEQKEINLIIHKDASENWRLYYQNNEVGYWPKELFNAFSNQKSTIVEWGGEVRNLGNGIHTKTQMGSGLLARNGYKRASYFADLYVQLANRGFTRVTYADVDVYVDKPKCYSLEGTDPAGAENPNTRFDFYYGGPGYNPRCLL